MEGKIERARTIPETDSINELACFWDTHDLTDFEDQLEEVQEPVFARRDVIKVPLEPEKMMILSEIAKSKGLTSPELVRKWILEKID
ncbi:MAG: CopG family antitoxin [Desulfoferrobacter sp.]